MSITKWPHGQTTYIYMYNASTANFPIKDAILRRKHYNGYLHNLMNNLKGLLFFSLCSFPNAHYLVLPPN